MLSGSLLLQNHPQLLYSVLKRVSFSDRKFGIVTFLLYFCADMIQPRQLWSRLTPLYEEGEARAIVMLLLEERFGLTQADLYCGGLDTLPQEQQKQLELLLRRLEQAEPVQYVLGEAWFAGRKYHVGPGVLIPRPETEELCRMVVQEAPEHPDVLDIGTGSGCIAITLALDIRGAHVNAWDISPKALQTARENAECLGAEVAFSLTDALQPPHDSDRWDIIVSNPPYVCRSEAAGMDPHVLQHEPHEALFVDDDDPLLFYASIARYATRALRPGGRLYFEINTAKGRETAALLTQEGFADVAIRQDPFGLPRYAVATRPTNSPTPTQS